MTETLPREAAEELVPPESPTARRDFALLWGGQSTSLLGDQFMVVALPLLAVTLAGASVAQAALLPFALYFPFLVLGLPAGAIVDRLRRRSVIIVCDAIQLTSYAVIVLLTVLGMLSFWMLLLLVGVIGCAVVFFQIAYSSYLPALFTHPQSLHKGNSRLFLSESVAKSLGPVIAGPLIQLTSVVTVVVANVFTFAVSVLAVFQIRTREPQPVAQRREPGWLRRDIRQGLAFVLRHPLLEPVIACGAVYVLFLSMIEATIVLYCLKVLDLGPAMTGLVVGAAALGFPVGNLLSGRCIARFGTERTLVFAALTAVSGLLLIPVAGTAGSILGLIGGGVLHGLGEGTFGPTSLTLRQTVAPAELLGRVNSVQRFLIWGAIPVGSLLAALSIKLFGLSGALWIGAIGTALCLPVLARRGVLRRLRGGSAGDAPTASPPPPG